MMMIFDGTVTIYNHYTANGSDAWKRTVLDDVMITCHKAYTMDSNGKRHAADSIKITVPYRSGFIAKGYSGTGFTFGLDNLDVVVIGSCSREITDNYDIEDLLADYDAYTITGYHDNTARWPKHWQVMAE